MSWSVYLQSQEICFIIKGTACLLFCNFSAILLYTKADKNMAMKSWKWSNNAWLLMVSSSLANNSFTNEDSFHYTSDLANKYEFDLGMCNIGYVY